MFVDHPQLGVAPPKVRHANVLACIAAIYARFIRLLVNTPGRYLLELVCAIVMSLVLGVFYYQLPLSRMAGANDRWGLFHTLLTLALVPDLCMNVHRGKHSDCTLVHTCTVHSERRLIQPDLDRALYGRTTFLIARV